MPISVCLESIVLPTLAVLKGTSLTSLGLLLLSTFVFLNDWRQNDYLWETYWHSFDKKTEALICSLCPIRHSYGYACCSLETEITTLFTALRCILSCLLSYDLLVISSLYLAHPPLPYAPALTVFRMSDASIPSILKLGPRLFRKKLPYPNT